MSREQGEPSTDVEAVAGKLTKAQREAMLNATAHASPDGQPFLTVAFTDPWTAPVAQFLTIGMDRLTPLGLAVRAHLLKEHP